MVRHAARVAIVTHTIATMASPLVPILALVIATSFWVTRFLALGMLPLGRGGAL